MPNWGQVLKEIAAETNDPVQGSAADKVRKKYLSELYGHTGRNVICYYSGWLSKPNIEGLAINDEDKNGFMLCVHGMDRSKGLDIFLHTPGGSGSATASIIDYIRSMFGTDVRAFVPQIAMSAGTIIACSCKEIFMGKQSNIGPVDPQINGLPAYAVVEELKTAHAEITADPTKQYVWNPILSRYTASFVQQCAWSIANGKQFVGDFMRSNMFEALPEPQRSQKVDEIVTWLTDKSANKGHDKHIHMQECIDNGLVIRALEEPGNDVLQDLVLTIHHCMMLTLSNGPTIKIIENQNGERWIKQFQSAPQIIPIQMMMPVPPAASPTSATPPSLPPPATA